MSRAALMALVLAALTASRAHAGACANQQLRVLPGDDRYAQTAAAAAPTNVEIRVLFDAPDVEVTELADRTTRAVAASGSASARDATFVLRTAAGAEVPVAVRRALDARHPVWLVRPTAELAANTAYVASVRTSEREYMVAHFTTTADRDTDAPTLERVTRAQVYRWPPVVDWKDPSGLYAELSLRGVGDAHWAEIHELADGEDPSETTLRWVGPIDRERVRFGATSSCAPSSYDLGPAPKTKGKRRIWVRTFDLAGNTSPTHDILLDTAHPRRAR